MRSRTLYDQRYELAWERCSTCVCACGGGGGSSGSSTGNNNPTTATDQRDAPRGHELDDRHHRRLLN